MSVKETPLATVKRQFGSKEKLVDQLVDRLSKEDSDESTGEMKHRLLAVSNKKLLRLAASLRVLDDKYGGKEQLVDAISQARGKSKDQDFKSKLSSYSVPRLLDMAP